LVVPDQSHELVRLNSASASTGDVAPPPFRLGSGRAFRVRAPAKAHLPEIRLSQIADIYVREVRCLGPAAKVIPPKLNRIIRVDVPHDPFLDVKVVGIIERVRRQTSSSRVRHVPVDNDPGTG
jgi:hypothetical protein